MTESGPAWRLLVHQSADGAWNMAVDEAILESYLQPRDGPIAPTLRLYGWSPPALSLGKGQRVAESCDVRELRRRQIDLVRRPTGGLAVLHDLERTYAVIGSLRWRPFTGGVLETYRAISEALEEAMCALGVAARASADGRERRTSRAEGPSCFAVTSAHEIAVGGRKMIGSAQLRRGGAFLQHGSILVGSDPARLEGVLGGPVDRDASTDLSSVLDREVKPSDLDGALVAAFGKTFGVELEPGTLSAREQARATQLRGWKHLSTAWTLDGRLGKRERRWGPVLAPELSPAR